MIEINLNKFITNTLPTEKGHLDQEISNLQSTEVHLENTDNYFFPQEGKAHENAIIIYPMQLKLTTYSDKKRRISPQII